MCAQRLGERTRAWTAARRSARAILLPALVAWALPATAEACHDVRVCVWFDVSETDDLSVGDYMTDELTPARGVRVTVVPPAPEPPMGTFLEPDGCIDLETQYTFGLTLVLHAEALLGQNDNIWIRAFDKSTVSPTGDGVGGVVDDSEEYTLPIHINGVADEDEVDVVVPPSNFASILAYTVETVYRLDNVYGASLTGAKELQVAYFDQDLEDGNQMLSALHAGFMLLLAEGSYANKKFTVGHEVGHFFHREAGTSTLNTAGYRYEAIDTPCEFCTQAPALCPFFEHALRSAEDSQDAALEGFAHFAAAAAFNNPTGSDGTFEYYKDLAAFSQYDDLADDNYLVSLEDEDLGGEDAWTENQCSNDFAFPLTDPDEQHVGSEIDWLRLYWRFVNDASYSGSLATVSDVLDIVAEAQDDGWNPDAYNAVLQAAEDLLAPGQDDRLDEIADDLGVFNDGP